MHANSISPSQALLPVQVWKSRVLASAMEAPAYSVGKSPPAAPDVYFLEESGNIWQEEELCEQLCLAEHLLPCYASQAT